MYKHFLGVAVLLASAETPTAVFPEPRVLLSAPMPTAEFWGVRVRPVGEPGGPAGDEADPRSA